MTIRLPKSLKLAAAAGIICTFLCGCWDSTNLESVDYVTALGVEYKDNKFIVYAQLIDFASVAKIEGNKGPTHVWIGRGSGDTFYGAYNELLKSAQSEMSIEQLKTVIVREDAMLKMDEILDALNRVRVARYTSWVFGTRAELADILTTDGFFGMPQTTSLIYSPRDQMRRANVIEPVNMQHFVARYNEQAVTVLLPVVGVSTRTWRQEQKEQKMQVIDGVFAVKEKERSTYFPIDSIPGVRWINPDFTRYLITIHGKGNTKATVALQTSRSKIKANTSRGGKPSFILKLNMSGEVAELSGAMSKAQIIDRVKSQIAEEVLAAYKEGVQKGEDLINLEAVLYRYHNKTWRKLTSGRDWLPGKDDLKVEVDFTLRNTGGFILR